MKKDCSVEWCQKKVYSYWLCNKHYARFKKHWDVNKILCTVWENRVYKKIYHVYQEIKARCLNTRHKQYCQYWWRWINVCESWLWINWFSNFYKDMWECPKWYSIDRIDNNWWYCKNNCRRATINQQEVNKRSNNKDPWITWSKQRSKWRSRLSIWWKYVIDKCFSDYTEAIEYRKYAENKYLLPILQD